MTLKSESQVLSLHRCKVCDARWLLWPEAIHRGGWTLLDKHQRPGACCDNVPMGEQIEHLRDIPLAPNDGKEWIDAFWRKARELSAENERLKAENARLAHPTEDVAADLASVDIADSIQRHADKLRAWANELEQGALSISPKPQHLRRIANLLVCRVAPTPEPQ